MYTPANAKSLENQSDPQFRILIQGASGVGKTWSALSGFKNPIVANFDKGLSAHFGRKDVLEVPFWDDGFIYSIIPTKVDGKEANRIDAYIKWLQTEGQRLEQDQTLINDAWTGVQNAIMAFTKLTPVYSLKTGKIDDRAPWARLLEYSRQLCEIYKSLQCNCITLCHETVERDKEGDLTGKMRPVQAGQFADQISSYYTDVFRMIAVARPGEKELAGIEPSRYGCNSKEELKKLFDSLTDEPHTLRFWQTRSDDIVNCKTILVGAPFRIPAKAEYYFKYTRISGRKG